MATHSSVVLQFGIFNQFLISCKYLKFKTSTLINRLDRKLFNKTIKNCMQILYSEIFLEGLGVF